MKIGVLTAPLGDRDRKAAFETVQALGYEAVELGSGEFTSDSHAGLDRLVAEPGEIAALRDDLDAAGLELSSLSCHGNPLHPNSDYAARADRVTRDSIRVAGELGSRRSTSSPDARDARGWGLPELGRPPLAAVLRRPARVAVERAGHSLLDRSCAFAAGHGVGLAIEMHPSNVVYNTDTLLRLREACGETVGANFDPTHLWWQGMDPFVSLRAIAAADALFNVHIKDIAFNRAEVERAGVLAIPAPG